MQKDNAHSLAHLLFVLFLSIFLSLFLIQHQVVLAGGWNHPKVLWVLVWSSTFIASVFYAIFGAVFWTIARRKHTLPLLLVCSIGTLLLVFNHFYFGLNGQHLDYEGLVLTGNGWMAGELGSPWQIPLAILAVVAGSMGLGWLLLTGLGTLTRWYKFKRPFLTAMILVAVALASFIHARIIAPINFRVQDLSIVLPWASLWGVQHRQLPAHLKLFDNPAQLSMSTETQELIQANKDFQNFPDTLSAARKPNILLVLVEGWRWDQLNAETTPKLMEWIKRGFVHLPHHYSTGNTTPSALFGFIGGMNAFFYQAHLETEIPSFYMRILQRLGYKHTVWEYDALSYNRIATTQFAPLGFEFKHCQNMNIPFWQKDTLLAHQLAASIISDTTAQPRLDFFLFYSSHFDYYYPPEFEKFKPAAGFDNMSSGANINLRAHRDQIFNKYRNALYFMDSQIDSLLSKLEVAGKLKNTVVFIGGDHGEEFWEGGAFGHTFRLTDWQTRTAAMMRFPDSFATQYKVSSHADVIPTILDYMDIKEDWRRFGSGKSLWKYEESRDHAIILKGGRKGLLAFQAAIAAEDYKIVFQNKWDLNKSLDEIRLNDSIVMDFNTQRVRSLVEKIPNHKHLPYPEHGI